MVTLSNGDPDCVKVMRDQYEYIEYSTGLEFDRVKVWVEMRGSDIDYILLPPDSHLIGWLRMHGWI